MKFILCALTRALLFDISLFSVLYATSSVVQRRLVVYIAVE
ncbi:hypothetical protein APHMUC_0371 [Anaplasma phagocytophilum str. ApMUC09]|uniref:Uncharacterized protein n=1 Tax=Anaplasma phagocytophilum str. ApMUC09 TaxID=1359152 RepID=A0A0F3N980_ANAPH|nr:hypothetical protein APHMUC_0371 [Anaplasma phagocytophilum str. ApMUC09]